MGERLREYYGVAKNKGGLMLQIKLAMHTHMAEPRAVDAPDSPENLQLFYKALRALIGDDPDIPRP